MFRIFFFLRQVRVKHIVCFPTGLGSSQSSDLYFSKIISYFKCTVTHSFVFLFFCVFEQLQSRKHPDCVYDVVPRTATCISSTAAVRKRAETLRRCRTRASVFVVTRGECLLNFRRSLLL